MAVVDREVFGVGEEMRSGGSGSAKGATGGQQTCTKAKDQKTDRCDHEKW